MIQLVKAVEAQWFKNSSLPNVPSESQPPMDTAYNVSLVQVTFKACIYKSTFLFFSIVTTFIFPPT